ncbi:tellurite resistance TerB C-terminal domain-containing protein [Chitinophaga sp. MM2321]|uniref:tellurite resistance TerB C-terminal domain-containing protein n=1 Tax=Chitinophaga sp. MM2321 TaxID=3137178 RepID=UPI0032D574F6
MKIFFILIRWIIGIFLCLTALGGFLSGEVGTAFFILVFGLVFLPPISKALFSKLPQNKTGGSSQPPTTGEKMDGTSSVEASVSLPLNLPPELQKEHISIRNYSTPKADNAKDKLIQIDPSNLAALPSITMIKESQQEKPSIMGDTMCQTDNSIIDITGESVQIKHLNPLPDPINKTIIVPYWSHRYIYSYDDINTATKEQFNFYQNFKEQFLKGTYIDIQENNNYAFILLFDLLKQFDRDTDFHGLESGLNILGSHYPKTLPYTRSFLLQKMTAIGDNNNVNRVHQEMMEGNQQENNYNYWGLGSKHKKTLNLDKASEKLLNRIWYQGNNFYDLEFCQLEIIKLFLAVLKGLQLRYNSEQQTVEQQFQIVADVIARKQYKYRLNSNNYKYCIQSTINELYIFIFKHCENAIRELYGHKRKLSIDNYSILEVNLQLEERILSKIREIIPKEILHTKIPDEQTEIELNTKNTTRWKSKLSELEGMLGSKNSVWFLEEVACLGKLNKNNPSIENIFFEASKILSKRDRAVSLILYTHYIFHDLNSKTFDNKPIAKTIQRNLFDNDEQALEFESIINNLIKTKNLKVAIDNASRLYLPKRKRIQLDIGTIKDVNRKYKGTVELLNELLQDESAIDESLADSYSIEPIEFPSSNHTVHSAEDEIVPVHKVELNAAQSGLLQIFLKNSWSVAQVDINTYAKSIGMFSNQLIESVNDVCFELIDDLLIEEDDDFYVINENYYQNIFSK